MFSRSSEAIYTFLKFPSYVGVCIYPEREDTASFNLSSPPLIEEFKLSFYSLLCAPPYSSLISSSEEVLLPFCTDDSTGISSIKILYSEGINLVTFKESVLVFNVIGDGLRRNNVLFVSSAASLDLKKTLTC